MYTLVIIFLVYNLIIGLKFIFLAATAGKAVAERQVVVGEINDLFALCPLISSAFSLPSPMMPASPAACTPIAYASPPYLLPTDSASVTLYSLCSLHH